MEALQSMRVHAGPLCTHSTVYYMNGYSNIIYQGTSTVVSTQGYRQSNVSGYINTIIMYK